MDSITVIVKHKGKKYDVEVDLSSPGEVFKFQLFSLTGVEPDRQKILVKGGPLRDDADMSKLDLKKGQNIMMMGTPSGAGKELDRPQEPVKFFEDMTEAEAAQQEGATPAGLVNLGNTCYLNSTLQTLRSIPELQDALIRYSPSSAGNPTTLFPTLGQQDLASELGILYKNMSNTQEGVVPLKFLNALRIAFPQFAERSRSNNNYAQQDAEEAWSQIVYQLKVKLNINAPAEEGAVSFVDKYMAWESSWRMECDDPAAKEAGEEAITGRTKFLKLNCHISANTNHLRDGIEAALTERVEKRSDVLDKDVGYTKKLKISRLPKYLTVHFVRFYWKRESQKKAKIMRKVTFPKELDLVEFCTDELKQMLVPVRDKVREIRKDEEDIERARKRRKTTHAATDVRETIGAEAVDKKDKKEEGKAGSSADGDTEMAETYKTDAQIDAEKDAALLAAKMELHGLINQDLLKDDGANQSGLYELRGVLTHQGASADSGHYTAYVKKPAPIDPKTGVKGEEDGRWWWFNDDKVSEVPDDKIETLSGGGETHSALILLYKAIALPSAEGKIA